MPCLVRQLMLWRLVRVVAVKVVSLLNQPSSNYIKGRLQSIVTDTEGEGIGAESAWGRERTYLVRGALRSVLN